MKLVIAIFGLLSALSAQVVCRPVDPKGSFDLSVFDSKEIAHTDDDLPLKKLLFTDYSSRLVRCFEHLHGTLALNNGEIVHDFYVEAKHFELWMSDAASCSPSLSKEPRFWFNKGIFQSQAQATKTKPATVPTELCRAPDHWPLATDN
jgi:hypothetical protein